MPRLSVAVLVAIAVCMGTAHAQEWPTRPVTMVVPFAAGGPGDVLGRILAPRLSDLLGQPVIVENVGGGGGSIGSSRVARAAPDGYQFVYGNVGTHAHYQSLYKNPLYNAASHFAPVALITETSSVLIVRKDLPVNDLAEFIAYAKANQTKMQYGSGGPGSPQHLTCELFNAAIGVNIIHIPYRGGGQAMQDLISGLVDYLCPTTPIAIPQIEAKQVKAIALLARDRSPTLRALASAHEQGLTDFESGSWSAFFLPKAAPAAIVRKLNSAAVAAMNTPSVQQRFLDLGAAVVAPERRSPEYLQKFVESEIARWATVIKTAGVASQ
jgi:tripartite-type tricarboxylate transporter receptor subunit TctC